ncbi:putative zinc-binding protein [Actomonas aquatica]|uniref:Zinc-binding protein n=1 Tax=Actomonas aquatica TaxID=2866162 RepID=A0ABZ1C4Y1_9BACT|nr:putative zinc-binding protein [Opitutus sp. WL0086]WRQ86571.1 putative zinc-binding protein [Opitutus sp. WL0086]
MSHTTTPAIADAEKPLIYSCSGCSSAAQLANHLALRLDRAGVAEMSCIVGLGGDVKPLVRTAKDAAATGRPIVMIDGCPLQCGRHTLARHGVTPALHWDLSRLAVAKSKHVDFAPADAARLEPALRDAVRLLAERDPVVPRRQ